MNGGPKQVIFLLGFVAHAGGCFESPALCTLYWCNGLKQSACSKKKHVLRRFENRIDQ